MSRLLKLNKIVDWTLSSAVPEEVLALSSISPKTGYGQSKWVAEQVLYEARAQRDLETTIVRVGQLCGSRISGNWNPWEWFTALVRSAQLESVKSLPNFPGVSSLICFPGLVYLTRAILLLGRFFPTY